MQHSVGEPLGLEIITLTAAPVWENGMHRENAEQRWGSPWAWRLQPSLLRRSGGAECIERMQNSVGEPRGLGDYNPHCCAGLGEQDDKDWDADDG